jgi:signal transduction histidine kinase
MLIIPLATSILVIFFAYLIFIGINGPIADKNSKQDEFFYHAVEQMEGLEAKVSKIKNIEQIKSDIDYLNKRYQEHKVLLSIYKDRELVYPLAPVARSNVLDLALSEADDSIYIIGNTAVYLETAGEYRLVLMGFDMKSYDPRNNIAYRNSLFVFVAIVLVIIVSIIIITNALLTRRIVKSIIKPLDTLAYGVGQIRDGNLDYQINYSGKDEFSNICSDFNEMAKRLSNYVQEKQKDEANRKELIAGISHDLRTPLTSIKAYVEGIESGLAVEPQVQKKYLTIIKNKANDLEHIVNQLFLFSKLEIGEFPFYIEPLDIGKELADFIATISEEYQKKGLKIEFLQNVENIYIQADIVQVRNAITNILENSVKYKNKAQGEMKISVYSEDNYVTIRLADNGPGVSKEALQRLFDIFYRSDVSRSNPSKGSGLGLAITQKIWERLGGIIKAENIEQGGLAIILMIPTINGGAVID